MIKKIIPREIQQTLIVGAAVFVGILYWGGRIMYEQSTQKLLKYKQERKRVQVENKIGEDLSVLQKTRQQMAAITESQRFLGEIAKITGQLNLKLRGIQAMPMEKRPEFVKLNVSLDIDTTYNELGLLVSKLESADIFIIIDKMELITMADKLTAGEPRISAKLNVSTIALTDTLLEK